MDAIVTLASVVTRLRAECVWMVSRPTTAVLSEAHGPNWDLITEVLGGHPTAYMATVEILQRIDPAGKEAMWEGSIGVLRRIFSRPLRQEGAEARDRDAARVRGALEILRQGHPDAGEWATRSQVWLGAALWVEGGWNSMIPGGGSLLRCCPGDRRYLLPTEVLSLLPGWEGVALAWALTHHYETHHLEAEWARQKLVELRDSVVQEGLDTEALDQALRGLRLEAGMEEGDTEPPPLPNWRRVSYDSAFRDVAFAPLP